MRNLVNLIILLVIFILFSCSGGNYFVLKDNTISQLEKPNDDIARVVFLQTPSGISTYGKKFVSLYDQDQLIGIIPRPGYITYDTKPGKHIFGALKGTKCDFVEANLVGGKTYYIVYMIYDSWIGGIRGKLLAVKKDSDLMKELETWLSHPKMKQSEPTEEGNEHFRVREDSKGKYVKVKPGWRRTFRIDIKKHRDEWIKKAEYSGKDKLLSEDGI